MDNRRLALCLFLLRITVFLVMVMWTIDKFINPEHASAVYAKFYLLKDFSHQMMYIFGGIEIAILVMFLLGIAKRISYGLVFVFHAISTLSSYKQYLAPFEEVNLLFFAAWPMLAACFTLYYLRDLDRKCCLGD